jgi:hypothetical protein
VSGPTFYLGTDMPGWLARTAVPLFVSRTRLARYVEVPRALGPWALDSGGFTELSRHGRWAVPAEQYVEEVWEWRSRVGGMVWAAQMDWMCEPAIRAKTGLTVAEHQRRTVANYLELLRLAPGLPWAPVLQGWTWDDYLAHLEMFGAAGVDLAALPVVGLGSVCRRQDVGMVESLIRELAGRGLRLHAFGFKLTGLPAVADVLGSSDSMAWSFDGRYSPPLPGCAHRNCSHCLRYALLWREKVLARVGAALSRPRQLSLW